MAAAKPYDNTARYYGLARIMVRSLIQEGRCCDLARTSTWLPDEVDAKIDANVPRPSTASSEVPWPCAVGRKAPRPDAGGVEVQRPRTFGRKVPQPNKVVREAP